jgi:hypothetical protein
MTATVLTGQDKQARDDTMADVRLAIADGLTAHDLDVIDPAGDGSQYLKVTNARNALCEIMINGNGSVSWEYRSFTGTPGPAQITGMVLELISAGDDIERRHAPLSRKPALTLTDIVGWILRERGMHVRLAEPGRADDIGELPAEIAVTNPARPDRGTARVSDGGMILWQCHLRDPAASTPGIDPREIAGTIARALIGAEGR